MRVFEDALATLERALEARGARHTVLAGNVANADTPGFSPLDVDFDEAMRAAQAGESSAPAARETTALASPAGLDGNRVDVDKAMAALAENGLQYGAAARAAAKKLAILRYVANDGVG